LRSRRSRSVRLLGHLVRLTLFALAGIAALRFFSGVLLTEGWTPRTFFALLLLTGALSLVWRATLDLARASRRRRA
jgi:hypothetical protein